MGRLFKRREPVESSASSASVSTRATSRADVVRADDSDLLTPVASAVAPPNPTIKERLRATEETDERYDKAKPISSAGVFPAVAPHVDEWPTLEVRERERAGARERERLCGMRV